MLEFEEARDAEDAVMMEFLELRVEEEGKEDLLKKPMLGGRGGRLSRAGEGEEGRRAAASDRLCCRRGEEWHLRLSINAGMVLGALDSGRRRGRRVVKDNGDRTAVVVCIVDGEVVLCAARGIYSERVYTETNERERQ